MLRRLAVTAAIAGAIAFVPRHSLACSCAPPSEPTIALAEAEAVFVAQIASAERQGRTTIVRARVKKAYKGVGAGKVVEIRTGLGGGDCGIRFTAGSSWLVYTHAPFVADPRAPKALYTGLCSRTTELAYAADDIKALDAAKNGGTPSSPSPPVPPSPPAPPSPPPSEPLLDAGLLMQDVDAGPAIPASSSLPPGSKGCACDLASSPPGGVSWVTVALAVALVAARRVRLRLRP